MTRDEYIARLADRLESIAEWIRQQTPNQGLTGANLDIRTSRKLWGYTEQLLLERDKLRCKRPYADAAETTRFVVVYDHNGQTLEAFYTSREQAEIHKAKMQSAGVKVIGDIRER